MPHHLHIGINGAGSIAHSVPSNRVEVYGSRGVLIVDIAGEKMLRAEYPHGILKELPLWDDESKKWEVELDFVRAVRGERPPEPRFEHGVA